VAKAGAAVLVGRAGGLIGANVEREVGVGRDIGAVAQVVDPLLLELITPANCCHEGIAIPSGEMPPPLSDPGGFRLPGPAALAVTRSVPPTETTCASSAGQASLLDDQVELSPEAAKKFWPCAAIFSK
jgi:hypothetical protein